MNSPLIIAEVREKCKSLLAKIPRDAFIISVLILACVLSFGLGYLAGRDEDLSAQTEKGSLTPLSAPLSTEETPNVGVVASKNGTKYYLSTCSGANRISAANKIQFASVNEAVTAGYTPAANCPGL